MIWALIGIVGGFFVAAVVFNMFVISPPRYPIMRRKRIEGMGELTYTLNIEHELEETEDDSAPVNELTELIPYLDDIEIEKYYLETDPDVKRQSLAIWNLRKQANKYSGLLHLESDEVNGLRVQACEDMSAAIKRETSYTESVANEYSRLARLIPLLTQKNVEEFTASLSNLQQKRAQLVEAQSEVAFEIEKQGNELREKFYELYKQYPFPFKRWNWAQQMEKRFNSGDPLTNKDIAQLHSHLQINESTCFIACREGNDVFVEKIHLRLERKSRYELNIRSSVRGNWLFYAADGSLSTSIDRGGKTHRIRNIGGYATSVIEIIPEPIQK